MDEWINLARAHWKEFLPKKYAQLEAKGPKALTKALYEAAHQTDRDLLQLVEDLGISEAEAWTMVRETYLLLRPEPEVTAALDAED